MEFVFARILLGYLNIEVIYSGNSLTTFHSSPDILPREDGERWEKIGRVGKIKGDSGLEEKREEEEDGRRVGEKRAEMWSSRQMQIVRSRASMSNRIMQSCIAIALGSSE